MSRDDRLYVDDILQAIAAIERYTSGLSLDAFSQEELVQDGVIRRLEIIGEAALHLSRPLRDQYPDIPWSRIAGMRNRLIHEYFGVLIERVWQVVEHDLPALKATMEEIQRSMDC